MYRTFTNTRNLLTAAAMAVTLAFSTSALAAKPDGPGKPGDLNIVDTAIAANSLLGVFDTVLTAATCPYFDGAVVNLLSGDDKYTLFAPTDDAFAAIGLDETNVCDLDADFLFTVLAYHVTDGRRFSNSVFNANNSKTIDMLVGGYITTSPDLTIHDNAGQTISPVLPFININASNGVIHVIDTVMLP